MLSTHGVTAKAGAQLVKERGERAGEEGSLKPALRPRMSSPAHAHTHWCTRTHFLPYVSFSLSHLPVLFLSLSALTLPLSSSLFPFLSLISSFISLGLFQSLLSLSPCLLSPFPFLPSTLLPAPSFIGKDS